MRILPFLFTIAFFATAFALRLNAEDNNKGYFDTPRIYVEDDIYMPVGLLAAKAPVDDKLTWDTGSAYVTNSSFRSGGTTVQSNLGVQLWKIRLAAVKTVGNNTLCVNLPFAINQVSGQIGGQPASKSGYGLGDLALIGKRKIWDGGDNSDITFAAGIELPTGRDNLKFNQSNTITNAFYPGNTQRIPLAWQPGSGSTNVYTSLSYSKTGYRNAFGAILACKSNGKGDSDVRLGNLWVLSLNATHSLNANTATSLGLIYRRQQNDSYPLAPDPGIGQAGLAGVTQHGTSISLSPSIRFRLKQILTVGLSFSTPIVRPSDGLVPESRWGAIVTL